jgi:hypothetical protein
LGARVKQLTVASVLIAATAFSVPVRAADMPPIPRCQRGIDGRAGDRPMAEPALDRPGVVALVGQRVAAGVPQHVGMGLQLQSSPATARSIIRAKPAVVNGDPRSLTKTKGDVGVSRWSRRRSGNRKLQVAQQSFGFPSMLNKRSSLVRRDKLLSAVGEWAWRARSQILEPTE